MKINNSLIVNLFVLFFLTLNCSVQAAPKIAKENPMVFGGGSSNRCQGRTYTQGAYGAGNGNTATQYLMANFNAVFPNGLTIGCGGNYLTLTSAAAVAAFLPAGTTPTSLPAGTLVDPGAAYTNILAGQLVTLILNAAFDAYDPNFSPSNISLANYTITSGTFAGMTVAAFINLANQIIGGCSTQYSYSQINAAATAINQNYDSGTKNAGFVNCQGAGSCTFSLSVTSAGVLCFGGSATVTITAVGGVAPYTGAGVFTLNAGSYKNTVTDVIGCQGSISYKITQPTKLKAFVNKGTILCNGGTTTVNVTSTGGTPPYTGTGIFTVSAGQYTYTVTDANGCKDVIAVTVGQPSQLVASSTHGTILCNGGTTTVNVTATGGIPPYTGTGIFTVSAGAHSFTVTDANGCRSVTTITLEQPSPLIATLDQAPPCGGATFVEITAEGGTAPYTGTGVFTLTAGPYSFTVTDANGCTAILSGTIVLPAPLTASATIGTILCHGGTTTINVTATGGAPPYSGTGIFVEDAGPYSFVVMDANGCIASVSCTIPEPEELIVSSTHGTILCNGGTTTVNVTATGGTSPYTGTGVFTVSAGPYSYTVTDSHSCTAVVSGTITEPSSLVASSTQGTILCNGGTTTVNVTAVGGTLPYTGTGIFTVSAGVHSFTVTDANGCSSSVTITLGEPSPLVVTVDEAPPCGGATFVEITADGGTAPYTGTGVFTLTAGPYSFTVTDANGCTAIVSGTIVLPAPLTASATIGTILCHGGTTTINVTATGGAPPYSGTGIFVEDAGPYSFVVMDANGCIATVSCTIPEPDQLVASSTISCSAGTGTVNVTATGGTSPYTGTGILTVTTGQYTFTVTDANGCTDVTSVVIDTAGCHSFASLLLEDLPLRVYPNPNNGSFKIFSDFQGEATILDQTGEVVKKLQLGKNSEVMVEDLANGLYVLMTPQWNTRIVVMRH